MAEDAVGRVGRDARVRDESVVFAALENGVAGEVEGVVEVRVWLDHEHAVACREGVGELAGELEAGEGAADDEDIFGVRDQAIGVQVEEGEELGPVVFWAVAEEEFELDVVEVDLGEDHGEGGEVVGGETGI